MICDPKLSWLLLLPAVPLMTPSISMLLKETSLPLETPPLLPPLDNVVGTNLLPSHLTPWSVLIPVKSTLFNSLILEMLLPALFSSSKYVIIFSTDFDDIFYQRLHIRNRKFTDFIKENIKNYQLIKEIKNENKFSKVNFYIYKKI